MRGARPARARLTGARAGRARSAGFSRAHAGHPLVFQRHRPLARVIAMVGLLALLVSYGAPPAKAFADQGPDPLPLLAAPELHYPTFGDGKGEKGQAKPPRGEAAKGKQDQAATTGG